MPNYTVTVSDEEEKALLWDMKSIQEWADNAIHNKARQCIENVCEEALNDQTDTILNRSEKGQIVSELAKSGRIITTVKQMPEAVKMMIVAAARIKSAAERTAEAEAEMGP